MYFLILEGVPEKKLVHAKKNVYSLPPFRYQLLLAENDSIKNQILQKKQLY